jgi:chemotaxis protein CheD
MSSPGPGTLAGFEQKVVVGVGDLAVSNDPSVVLTTYSLGSCIGVTIYDAVARVGGLLHIMLPDSSINPARAAHQPAMFADTGVPALFRIAYQMKADKHRVVICVAGGAQMMDQGGVFNIGKRNHDAVVALLNQHGLKVQATQVGGLVSRTILFNIRTGEVRLKVSGQAEDFLLCKRI